MARRPKPEHLKKVKLSVTLEPTTRAYLEELADQTGFDLSNIVETLILNHKLQQEKAQRKGKKQAKTTDEQVEGQLTTADLGIQ